MKIKATVVYQDLEGGFWGLATDEGVHYEPVEALPADVQTDGCRVEAEVEPVEMLSFRQWGRPVRVHTIQQI